MRFSDSPGLILFSDTKPGTHATMFGPDGKKLPFRDDESSFNDSTQKYTWAFEWTGDLLDGMRFIFATSDRAIMGGVKDGAISILAVAVDPSDLVVLEAGSKPYKVKGL